MKRKRIMVPFSPSRYSSRKEWEEACWKEILKSPDLLQTLITSHERRDLVMRAAALEAIASGKSYRQIGRELWLSPQTVSGIKKAAKENNYKSYLERSKTERKRRIYSVSRVHPKSKRREGTPRRTKYGIVYLP